MLSITLASPETANVQIWNIALYQERPTPPALENTVKTMLWSNPHKIGNIYYERIFVLSDQATI